MEPLGQELIILNTARYYMQVGNQGPYNSTLVAGGATPSAGTQTEGYDGTSWSTRPSLGSVRRQGVEQEILVLALAFGGNSSPPTILATSENFTAETSAVTAKTLTTS